MKNSKAPDTMASRLHVQPKAPSINRRCRGGGHTMYAYAKVHIQDTSDTGGQHAQEDGPTVFFEADFASAPVNSGYVRHVLLYVVLTYSPRSFFF